MASKKDLVEAYAYNRRRLVTAFVSGAPGGREVEPSRPGKAIIVGVVLAGLVVGGAALTGFIKPTVKDGWDDNSLVVGRKTGARYFATQGNLFPVANTTSARLLAPAGEFKVVFAPEDDIAETNLQDRTVGILGAPDAVPRPEDLLQSGWVSCVRDITEGREASADGGTSLRISTTSTAAEVPGQALVVRVGKDLKVVAGGFGYAVANEAVISALGLNAATAMDVPAEWFDQFQKGSPLRPLAKGDLLTEQRTGQHYLNTQAGAFPLNQVQYEMFKLGRAPERTITGAPANQSPTVPAGLADTQNWPENKPAAYDGGAVACVILYADEQIAARTVLARPLEGFTAPKPEGTVSVDAGRGALVRAPGGGSVFLIDALGKGYPLESGTAQDQLGFADIKPVFVLPAWISAVRDGVKLGAEAARQEVATDAGQASNAAPQRAATAAR